MKKDGKEYLNVQQILKLWTNKYHVLLRQTDIYNIFKYFGYKFIKIPSIPKASFFSRRDIDELMFGIKYKDFENLIRQISQRNVKIYDEFYDDYIPLKVHSNKQNTFKKNYLYKNGENDNDSYSNYLIQQYQTENKIIKKVKISENTFKRLFEGVEYSKNGDKINLSVNTKSDDESNKDVDTRVFGTKNDILYGDNTTHGKRLTLFDTVKTAQERIKTYQSVIKFAENNFTGEIYKPTAPITKNVQLFVDANDKEGLINYAQTSIDRAEKIVQNNQGMINRLNDYQGNQISPRYSKMTIQGTNIPVIALFTMKDFNFSDGIKNGKLRQNGLTDKILGIDKNDRTHEQGLGKGQQPYKKIDVTYDNRFDFNLADNFSYTDSKDHYRKQYQDSNEYSSVNQFLDKSIIYASYALNKEHFKPDYIVSVPSSSRFNEYYCNNLSKKLGVPYIKDFFQRNLINVQIDENLLRQDGIDEKDIFALKNMVIKAVYSEIATYAKQPIETFISNYEDVLTKISLVKMSRDKADISLIKDILSVYIFNSLNEYLNEDTDNVAKMAVKKMFNNEVNSVTSKHYNVQYLFNEILKRIKANIGKKILLNVINEVYSILKMYSQKLSSGYKFDITANRFKITAVQKRFRKYLNNVYVISDAMLNKDHELFTRYKTAHFLIFDEDINSGASLKLTIDAIKDKNDISDKNLMCLVNAYSNSGW